MGINGLAFHIIGHCTIREIEPISPVFFDLEIFIRNTEFNMEPEPSSKIVLTLKNDQVSNKQKRSSAYSFVERNLSHLMGENVPATIYLGGDRDLVIRYVAHLINMSSFEVEVINDTSKFINDPDFEN